MIFWARLVASLYLEPWIYSKGIGLCTLFFFIAHANLCNL